MIPDAYDAYVLWLGIKHHFTTKYDFVKYGGKTKVTRENFEKKNYKKLAYRLASKYNTDLKRFFISVYARDGTADLWIGDLLQDTHHREFLAREKRVQALSRTFSKDVKVIAEYMEESSKGFREVLTSTSGNLPPIVQLENRGMICPETAMIIHRLTGYLDKYNVHHPSWDDNKLRLTKLKPFVRVDDIRTFATLLRDGLYPNH
jgi:hypothetical protein